MKIIAIIGSPKKKGAGYTIVKKIENRMKAMGKMEFEYLFLKDADLKPCTGCYNCMARGEEKCPIKDDRALIEQKLEAADGIILSSPVYVNNVSWLMKNFMDRFAYRIHRPCFQRQKVMSVVNMAGGGQKETLAALRNALGVLRIVHELAIETPPWLQTQRAVARKEKVLDTAAKKFYKACLDTSLPSPTFENYMNFYIFQMLSFECRESLPADYAFYRGKTYYYDTNLKPVKAAVAKAWAGMKMHLYKMAGMGPGNVAWPLDRRCNKVGL